MKLKSHRICKSEHLIEPNINIYNEVLEKIGLRIFQSSITLF